MSAQNHRRGPDSWFMKILVKMKMRMRELSTLDRIILPMLAVGYTMASVATYLLILDLR